MLHLNVHSGARWAESAFHGTRSAPFRRFDISRSGNLRGEGIYASFSLRKALDFCDDRQLIAEVFLKVDPIYWLDGNASRGSLPQHIQVAMAARAEVFRDFNHQSIRDWISENAWRRNGGCCRRRMALLGIGVTGLRCEDDVGSVRQELLILTGQLIHSHRWLKAVSKGYRRELRCFQTDRLVHDSDAIDALEDRVNKQRL